MVNHDVVETLRCVLKESRLTVFLLNRSTEHITVELHFPSRQQFVIGLEQLRELLRSNSLPDTIVEYLQQIGLAD